MMILCKTDTLIKSVDNTIDRYNRCINELADRFHPCRLILLKIV